MVKYSRGEEVSLANLGMEIFWDKACLLKLRIYKESVYSKSLVAKDILQRLHKKADSILGDLMNMDS